MQSVSFIAYNKSNHIISLLIVLQRLFFSPICLALRAMQGSKLRALQF